VGKFIRALGWIVVALVIGTAAAASWVDCASAQTVYRIKLEAQFTFDGQPYTAIGYMECTYRRAPILGSRSRPAAGPPIYEGYYTETFRDAASVVLADGKGAILFRHGGRCHSLPQLQKIFATKRESVRGESFPAYYFPDRHDTKTVWYLRDRRSSHKDHGRFVLQQYRYVLVDEPVPASLAQNVPAAWKWYQEYSAEYRKAISESRIIHGRNDKIWRGIYACVLLEDEWKRQPDFVRAIDGVSAISVVALNQPRENWARNCPSNARTPQISLIPSEDHSRATLDLDRSDLRWATVTVPYVAEFHDRVTSLWMPELCVAGEGCTGIRLKTPYWLYFPNRRALVRLDEVRLEASHFSDFAARHGDGI
jgi:hypothetical protein